MSEAQKLEDWKAMILRDVPNAYEVCPQYMAMLDADIEKAKESEGK